MTFRRTSRTRRARENESQRRPVCLRSKQVRAEQGLRAALPAPGCTRYMNTSEQLPSMPGLLETSRRGRGQRDLLSLLFPSALQQAPSVLAQEARLAGSISQIWINPSWHPGLFLQEHYVHRTQYVSLSCSNSMAHCSWRLSHAPFRCPCSNSSPVPLLADPQTWSL